MRYYKSLGDETNISDDQLANNAYMLLQGKGGNLADRQIQFAQDIFLTYRMLMQIADMGRQYNRSNILAPTESNLPIITNPPAAKKDSKATKK